MQMEEGSGWTWFPFEQFLLRYSVSLYFLLFFFFFVATIESRMYLNSIYKQFISNFFFFFIQLWWNFTARNSSYFTRKRVSRRFINILENPWKI